MSIWVTMHHTIQILVAATLIINAQQWPLLPVPEAAAYPYASC